MIKPTTSESPFKYVRLLFFSKLCCPPSSKPCGVPGVPSAVYPAPDELSGKSALLKSNALDTEKLLRSIPGSGLADVGVISSSKESFREEGGPPVELDSRDSRPPSRSFADDANDASSRLSRGGRSV
jgi:hypothetical protein